MASSSKSENTPPDVSDITSLLSTMKKQNEEILANERDNSSSQKHSDTEESRKRNQSEDEAEKYQNEQSISNNKRARVSVANLPKHPVSFNTLDDDCLGYVLDFVGKRCYNVFVLLRNRKRSPSS